MFGRVQWAVCIKLVSHVNLCATITQTFSGLFRRPFRHSNTHTCTVFMCSSTQCVLVVVTSVLPIVVINNNLERPGLLISCILFARGQDGKPLLEWSSYLLGRARDLSNWNLLLTTRQLTWLIYTFLFCFLHYLHYLTTLPSALSK